MIARLDCQAASCTSDYAKKAPHGSMLTIALQTRGTDLQWWIFAAKKVHVGRPEIATEDSCGMGEVDSMRRVVDAIAQAWAARWRWW